VPVVACTCCVEQYDANFMRRSPLARTSIVQTRNIRVPTPEYSLLWNFGETLNVEYGEMGLAHTDSLTGKCHSKTLDFGLR
jgi:hypothetical protein